MRWDRGGPFLPRNDWSGVPDRGRMIEGRMADALTAKPYAGDANHTSRNRHLRERGIALPVEACPENEETHRVISDQAHSRW